MANGLRGFPAPKKVLLMFLRAEACQEWYVRPF